MQLERLFGKNSKEINNKILINKETKKEYKIIGGIKKNINKFALEEIDGDERLLITKEIMIENYLLK